jgi:hypothetical protein
VGKGCAFSGSFYILDDRNDGMNIRDERMIPTLSPKGAKAVDSG